MGNKESSTAEKSFCWCADGCLLSSQNDLDLYAYGQAVIMEGSSKVLNVKHSSKQFVFYKDLRCPSFLPLARVCASVSVCRRCVCVSVSLCLCPRFQYGGLLSLPMNIIASSPSLLLSLLPSVRSFMRKMREGWGGWGKREIDTCRVRCVQSAAVGATHKENTGSTAGECCVREEVAGA